MPENGKTVKSIQSTNIFTIFLLQEAVFRDLVSLKRQNYASLTNFLKLFISRQNLRVTMNLWVSPHHCLAQIPILLNTLSLVFGVLLVFTNLPLLYGIVQYLRNATDLCLGDTSVPVRIKSARAPPCPLGYPIIGRVC